MNIQVDVVNLNKGEVSNRYKIARDVPKTTGSQQIDLYLFWDNRELIDKAR